MKHATTQKLIRLDDEAVLNNFSEWLTAAFLDDVHPDGLHVLVHVIPHGIRPGSSVTGPDHFRK